MGILFLRTNGLIDMEGPLSTEQSFDLQVWATGVAGKIPDTVFIAVGALVALGVWAWWSFGRGKNAPVLSNQSNKSNQSEQGDQTT